MTPPHRPDAPGPQWAAPPAPGYPAPAPGHPGSFGYPGHPSAYHQRPAASRQPATVILARVFTFGLGAFAALLAFAFAIASLGARFDPDMGADAERVSNEIGLVALTALVLAVVFFVLGGIGGRRSPAVLWSTVGIHSVVAVLDVVGVVLMPDMAVILAFLVPFAVILTLLLVRPSRNHYHSAYSR
ncbi:hypothetical protein LP52_05295 [Streptomonospora alba]|uniref:Uncharacterized protein n=1 Tax=Streptomonospora alba TaxID=183763 RepID=A0A0C2G8I2_9ACTN|nr:hypothetical protein [Streptomonospora alba]KIH99668.1 hypothetical protein LP52_05295 [Streptomonospora alba]